ncbi:hypothetical protein GQ457_18G004680 [Hibiscus cannabinus]
MVKLFQVFYTLAILLLFISAEVNAGNVDGINGENSSIKLRRCREIIGMCNDKCDDACCDKNCWAQFLGPLEGKGRCVATFCTCFFYC